MQDAECVSFLQQSMPRLGLRWAGFRRVYHQVCKRLQRRLRVLDLADISAYRAYLEQHTEEWQVLDGLCRITISRFFRNRRLFDALATTVSSAAVSSASFVVACAGYEARPIEMVIGPSC